MPYNALTLGLADNLLAGLQVKTNRHNITYTICPTVQEAGHLLHSQKYQLLIVDLDYLRSITQTEWLGKIRHISFIPVIILSDTPEEDAQGAVEFGADMCLCAKWSYPAIAALVFAQLRRYTQYNHYDEPHNAEAAPFRVGDIFIDPARRIVDVCSRSVKLRPREFLLLLYFMRNPGIVLTSEQICEHAWGMEGSYNQGVAHPIRLLRQAIEPDPVNPVYIETVHRVGYRFTAHNSETCDKC